MVLVGWLARWVESTVVIVCQDIGECSTVIIYCSVAKVSMACI